MDPVISVQIFLSDLVLIRDLLDYHVDRIQKERYGTDDDKHIGDSLREELQLVKIIRYMNGQLDYLNSL